MANIIDFNNANNETSNIDKLLNRDIMIIIDSVKTDKVKINALRSILECINALIFSCENSLNTDIQLDTIEALKKRFCETVEALNNKSHSFACKDAFEIMLFGLHRFISGIQETRLNNEHTYNF